MPIADSWFEVYKAAPAVFAIYEPHQSEEVISYLIVGDKRALLFDTGMGIGHIKRVTAELTQLPIVVLNSHTHNDHVGDNWRFDTISRASRVRMHEDRGTTPRPKSPPIRFVASCPRDLIRKHT